MTRRIVQHQAKSIDNEVLTVVHIFEEGINKEAVKKIIPYSKKHNLLIKQQEHFEYMK